MSSSNMAVIGGYLGEQNRWSLTTMNTWMKSYQRSIFLQHVDCSKIHRLSPRHFFSLSPIVLRQFIQNILADISLQKDVFLKSSFIVFSWFMHVCYPDKNLHMVECIECLCSHGRLSRIEWLFDHTLEFPDSCIPNRVPCQWFLAAARAGHLSVMRFLEDCSPHCRCMLYTRELTEGLSVPVLRYLAVPVAGYNEISNSSQRIFRLSCQYRCIGVMRECLSQPPHSNWRGRRVNDLEDGWNRCISAALHDIIELGDADMWTLLIEHYEFGDVTAGQCCLTRCCILQ